MIDRSLCPSLGPRARLSGRIASLTLESEALKGNPLGDPSSREVIVYLPPSYDRDAERRYPVVCILAPFAASNHSLVNYRLWETSTFELYEELIEQGTGEAILFSPDAMNRWGGSQFIDSPASGNYAQHVLEALDRVEASFRTIGSREGRAIVGRSSGGFGALRMAIDHPGIFSAIGSHAGDGLFEVSIRPSFTSVAIALARAGGVVPFLSKFERNGPRASSDFETIAMIATAAAYAPRPDLPFPHFELPFDIDSGLPVPHVWQRFLEHDPVERLEHDPNLLRDASLVYLDAGDRDEHGLQFAARRMAKQLEARGARVLHQEFDGGHRGTHARYAESLPRLIGALSSPGSS